MALTAVSSANEIAINKTENEEVGILTLEAFMQTARPLFPQQSLLKIVEEAFHPAVLETMTEIVGPLNAKNHLGNETNRWVTDYTEHYFAKNFTPTLAKPLETLGNYDLKDRYDFSWVPQDPKEYTLSYNEETEKFALYGQEMHSVIFSLNGQEENLTVYLRGKEENHQTILENMANYFDSEVVGDRANFSSDEEALEASRCYNRDCSYTYQVKNALTLDLYREFFAEDFFSEFPEPHQLWLYVMLGHAAINGVGMSYSLDQKAQILAALTERFGEGNYANLNDERQEWISPDYHVLISESDDLTLYFNRVKEIDSAVQDRPRADKLWQCFDTVTKEHDYRDYVASAKALSEYLCSVKAVEGIEAEYIEGLCQQKSLEYQALSKISIQDILINSLEHIATDAALDQLANSCSQ